MKYSKWKGDTVMSIYEYTVPTPTGEEVALSDFKGKVVIVFTPAPVCFFPPPSPS